MEHIYSTYATRRGRRPPHPRWLILVISAWGALAWSGCPTSQDDLSGTYIEINPTSVDEVLVLDVFRFGEHMMLIKRRVRRELTSGGLGAEIECEWSELSERFNEDSGQFELILSDTNERITGAFNAEQLTARLTPEDASVGVDHTLRLASASPDNRCMRISDFFFKFNLGLSPSPTSAIPADYTLRQAAFELLWVAVEPQERDGFIQWIALSDRAPTVPLSPGVHVDLTSADAPRLMGRHSLSIPSPPERVLVRSGETRYALAHFTVIDHQEGFEPGDAWQRDEEPLIATALELGTRADSPPNTLGVGKALLFVEGDLTQLGPILRARLRNLNTTALPTSRHFYIVDVFFDEDSIIALDLPDDLLDTTVNLRTTARYLDTDGTALPRLFPL